MGIDIGESKSEETTEMGNKAGRRNQQEGMGSSSEGERENEELTEAEVQEFYEAFYEFLKPGWGC
jgi:hypothetical protein